MGSASGFRLTAPEVSMESMDFLSRGNWCNSTAIQIFGPPPPPQDSQAIVLHERCNSIRAFENDIIKHPLPKVDNIADLDDGGIKSVPPWNSNNDMKSWIMMQQAMHPEVNYHRCFRKKLFSWKLMPFKNLSIQKWVKDIKQRRKEDDRLHRAEVHAAISVAGVAAALAAIAAENTKQNHQTNGTSREAAVASAAALVAAQCAQIAEAMGAKREQLSSVMGSAMNTATTTDILTLTAAAATSLRGAATLKARPGCRERLTGPKSILPIEDSNDLDFDFDFEEHKSVLAKGAQLSIESSDGKYMYRSVSIVLNHESKVVLKIRKANLLSTFANSKEYTVLDLHAELYNDDDDSSSEADGEDTSYYIVLTTNRGILKLDMEDDYERYSMWANTVNHMLMLSTTVKGSHQLQIYKE